MKRFKTATVAAMCAATTLAGVSLAPAAHAEGQGGCYRYHNARDIDGNTDNLVIWKACTNSLNAGEVHGYAFITLAAKHPKCQLEFTLLKSGGGSKIYDRALKKCPTGKATKKYVHGFYSPFKNRASFTVVVRVRGFKTDANAVPRSPWIKMP
ncbi:hypothetical protein [Streptomyces chattanoogensis]|uniref:hypothetical protein n=1 Tax=Streptomyces chattanoogensis TaxID=66876 RepID=UPI0036CF9D81